MAPTEKEMSMECALCGYKASGKFEGDICPQCNLTY
jgi:rubrerythrin